MLQRPLLAAALTLAAFTAAPALAAADPPVNDNYLASLTLPTSQFTVDTSQATTQPDIFNPSATGQPLGGAGPEPASCNGTSYGKTVWYDLHPKTDEGVELALSGFPGIAVAVYEWSEKTSLITSTVTCAVSPVMPVDFVLQGGNAYTVQLGGVVGPAGPAGGPLTVAPTIFPDSDNDGILDALDKCPKVAGIARDGGCPPDLIKVHPRIAFNGTPSGITISRLSASSVPKGAKLVASCSACHVSQTLKLKHTGSISVPKFAGRPAPAGSTIKVQVTMAATGSGTYKFGATGLQLEWHVRAGGVSSPVQRCLAVKTNKVQKCS